ncbi:hypothetical protein ANN_03754 [Periplaneta americana]|uniref:Uncharacterized protein n=1 Tax=Periplaneta americana TaxID=6978 RepID=A0ABQ8U334_PERAM|nr:hypothetical protein ANN_03754 [Periplaneta americana]
MPSTWPGIEPATLGIEGQLTEIPGSLKVTQDWTCYRRGEASRRWPPRSPDLTPVISSYGGETGLVGGSANFHRSAPPLPGFLREVWRAESPVPPVGIGCRPRSVIFMTLIVRGPDLKITDRGRQPIPTGGTGLSRRNPGRGGAYER